MTAEAVEVLFVLPERKSGCRWFIRRGARTYFDNRGFRSREEASMWIERHGEALEWRVGFLFKFKGDTENTEIVNRKGVRA